MPYKDKEKKLAKQRAYYSTPWRRAGELLKCAKRRGKHAVEITQGWIADRLKAGVCEVTGLPFVLDGRGRSPWSPSLDRTDNALPYTAANTKVVCWIFNNAKGDGTYDDVLKLAQALLCTPSVK